MARVYLIAASAAAAAFALGGAPAAAATYVLDFSGDICSGPGDSCGNYTFIHSSYGDVAGVVDVEYDGNLAADGAQELQWWDAYSGLPGVAWGSAGATVEIFLNPGAGYSITLQSFNLGSYQNANRSTQYYIRTGGGTLLDSEVPLTVGASPFLYDTSWTSSSGIRIQWGPDGYDVGIDNITFSVDAIDGAVPEPASWAMMIAGLGLAGGLMRRRSTPAPRAA